MKQLDDCDGNPISGDRLLDAPDQSAAPASESKPSQRLVHASLIITQCIFGGGSVVGKLGVSSFNPVLFALIREGCAGPILCAIAWYRDRMLPKKGDLWLFALAGACLFSNQLGFIVGAKLSSAVIGSAWQPTQPIFSATIAICLGWERNSVLKFIGILVGLLGAVSAAQRESGGLIQVWHGAGIHGDDRCASFRKDLDLLRQLRLCGQHSLLLQLPWHSSLCDLCKEAAGEIPVHHGALTYARESEPFPFESTR